MEQAHVPQVVQHHGRTVNVAQPGRIFLLSPGEDPNLFGLALFHHPLCAIKTFLSQGFQMVLVKAF